jgi:hypothetical protein
MKVSCWQLVSANPYNFGIDLRDRPAKKSAGVARRSLRRVVSYSSASYAAAVGCNLMSWCGPDFTMLLWTADTHSVSMGDRGNSCPASSAHCGLTRFPAHPGKEHARFRACGQLIQPSQ